MENISEAIKMAGAALIFILLLSVTINIYSQAKDTADIVLFSSDSTNFYQHIKSNQNGVTREVGLETIIPTLYTYCQTDGPSIRIIYGPEGSENRYEEIFDTELESILNSNNTNNRRSEKIINKYGSIYGTAPWSVGYTNHEGQLERINAFIYGNSIEYNQGQGFRLDYSSKALINYKNHKFEESYVNYNTSGKYKNDGSGNWYTIVDGQQKTIITYKLIK
ncbi:MAG: hypothetical protein IKG42_01785 [Clostridia bacterium]|nr:hypothetical protein [Clostridia bacterium]